jgi:hypothetical protein
MSVLSSPEYVEAGSRIVWTGQFPSFLVAASETPNDAITRVGTYLRNNYNLIIERSDNGISWGGLGGGSITLYLRTDIDRGDGDSDDGLTDILGNVCQAFQNIGDPPITAVINSYTKPSGTKQNTGTPLPPVSDTPRDSSTSWWDQFVGKVEAGSLGFVIGSIAVVALIVVVAVKSEV